MCKYLLVILGIVTWMGFASSVLAGESPKQSSKTPALGSPAKTTYTVSLYCCDTCKPAPCPSAQVLQLSNLVLIPSSPSDSSWMQLLPHNLSFKIVPAGKGRKVTFTWPGVKLEKMDAALKK